MLSARIERTKAEAFRKRLTSMRFVDTSVLIIEDGESVLIPLLSSPGEELLAEFGATLEDDSFPLRKVIKDPIDQVAEIVDIPASLKPALPKKWEKFGDVLVLRLDHSLDRHEIPVAKAYAAVLGAKSVLRDVGGITGDLREPVIRPIIGSDTIATHLENGILFRFDAAKIMFSSGNVEERARMADTKCDSETIVDMFAGIGYFSIPIAFHQSPKKVIACEVNPVAHSFLQQNIELNAVGPRVEPVLGDNRSLEGESFADRVIMGYVKTTHEFLPTAFRIVKSGGMIHYHETCPNDLLPQRPVQHLQDYARDAEVSVERMKAVKSYSPGVSHVVVDARVLKPA